MSRPAQPLRRAPQDLAGQGWFHGAGIGDGDFSALLDSLGKVIWRTEVCRRPGSRALVTSLRALDFHTDHHRADYVAWRCLRGDRKGGGQSVLVSAEEAFGRLDGDTRKALARVELLEHKAFPGDPDRFPLVSASGGRRKFYYSFWLADPGMPAELHEAMKRFRDAVAESAVTEISLREGDALVVDNGAVLHGRREIKDAERRLDRYWLARPPASRRQEPSAGPATVSPPRP